MENDDFEEVTLDMEEEAEPQPKRDSEPEPAKVESDDAAEAFARLEGEMALMRRAVQHLAAERADIVIPDYEATLTEMTKRLGAISGSLDDIAGHPAMQVTPDSFGRRIEAAAEVARRGDQDRINSARNELRQATHDMRAVSTHARTSADQRRTVYRSVGGGVLVGILLWSFLPGTIARAVPESWQWPEAMARRLLGEPTTVDAGVRMMRKANPQAWEAIAYAAKLSDANADAIERCKARAQKAERPLDCTIRIGS